jgi:hypothetical protein
MPDDDILDISAEDLAEDPAPVAPLPPVQLNTAPALDLSLDDLNDEPAAAFPALTADQLLASRSSVTIRTLCSQTGRPFLVRYVEDKPGLYVTHEVTVLGKDEAGAGPGTTGGAVGEVTGSFQTSKDYACPFCGSHAVLVCGRCGVDLCAGPGNTGRCTCPNCQAQIEVGGRATSATGLLGLGKGKSKKL